MATLRQQQQDGRRSPHKPLLVLLALSRLAAGGSSELPWDVAEQELADLLEEFGPPSRTGRAQSAAYPFTRLRSDGVWTLDRDVPMDKVGPLRAGVTGRFEASLEAALRSRPGLVDDVARGLVEAHLPATVAPDVLVAVGLDPELLHGGTSEPVAKRQRSSSWPAQVLEAWDRQCAFCGFDGQVGGVPVGLEAAHIRWFTVDGPDELDNGLALCSLHHKLFDRGVLGLDDDLTLALGPRPAAVAVWSRDGHEPDHSEAGVGDPPRRARQPADGSH
ncbi:restriction endonuclease [Geodermatophilus normandii]|uniref:Restriction endonuclease n=1 Tax=Geodermatophilus normandii TaxID=1137989 RepID=A0A6P0GD07_9ACTN|nr:HNH endonuclease [Geodermatophilus normandii]NEM05465.1 restriction endonuclease [Geodermatophilus normandii]